jgi:4a-hydroxytetrahydrobiopterin dehydratase
MSDLIEEKEIAKLLKKIPEWEHEKKTIFRVIEFDEFMDGIDFVDGVAEIAEEYGHHPDIDIRWCSVTVYLTTHDQGGLTEADFELAKKIDTLID